MLVPGLEPCEAGEPEIEALVAVMRKHAGIEQGTIPAGFTYLGQFIDHDITFDPTPFSARRRPPGRTVNFRTPRLDLDSLYGLGPDVQPYLYERDRPERLLLSPGPPLDLPRNAEGTALTGDPRNDENAIVSQLHLLFARFHNRVAGEVGSFTEARRIVVRHYHWIVLKEFLPLVLGAPFEGPRKHFRPEGEPFIPVEFSGAAYRFGHTMVRPDYGTKPLPEDEKLPGPGPLKLFPDLEGFRPLADERVIAWERFFELVPRKPQESSMIDRRLAPRLFELPFGEPKLALRTLRRGIKLRLPSGQALAAALGLPGLGELDLFDDDDLDDGPIRETLVRSTPLWYWILCEAKKGGGLHLGPLGRLIVGEVLTGLIETDPASFLREQPDWEPGQLGGTKGAFSMASFVRFARGEEPD
ncbi:MAG: peroxidase [Thermoleophilia bacterium]|nr:peroxidase [Thermoleophilia bacterium]